MANIFITQENRGFDYEDAERFGDIVFLTNMEYSPQKSSLNNSHIRDQIKTGLKYMGKGDYLVLTGNPVNMAYAFHVACRILGGKGCADINVLRWDNMRGQYIPISVPIDI